MQRVSAQPQRSFARTDRYSEFPEVESKYVDFGRVYLSPKTGKWYPSVTTVLGNFDKEWLEKWRADVGEEKANEIREKAGARGTRVHTYAEDYMRGKMAGGDYVIWSYDDHDTFMKLKRAIDDHVGDVHAQEVAMVSDEMEMGGRCDLIADFFDPYSPLSRDEAIWDFKTSAKQKFFGDVKNYFAQETAYSLMVQEHTGRRIAKLVIAMPCDELKSCQIFVARRGEG